MIATGLPAGQIHLFWPHFWHMLQPAYEKSDEKPTESEVLTAIHSQALQAWAVFDRNVLVAGILSKFLREATSGEQHCHLWLIAGSHLSDWSQDFLSKLIPWAKAEGCSAVTGNGRKGWARIVARHGGYRAGDRWRLDL